jgi:hypothetical protein
VLQASEGVHAMKSYPLAFAVAFAPIVCPIVANAVNLNPRGIGQVLLYPYYTVNKGQDTLLSVGNTTGVGKAVVVRVLEGYNGREVLSFDLFLSPHDVWTASISQIADDGGGSMRTSDRSCTDPPFPVASVPLLTSDFDGTGSVPADGGPQTPTRTREGSIEMIQLGDIDPASALATATTHVQNGNPDAGIAPCGVTVAMEGLGIVAPTGGLFGSASIVNVGEGTFFAYNADALQGFSDHAFSSTAGLLPTLQDANSSELPSGGAIAYVFDPSGRPLALSYAFGVDAVSAVFMADSIENEYIVGGGLGANTDWVVTFPTKRFYVDDNLYARAPADPFVEAFHPPGESNVTVPPAIHDREEGRSTYFDPCDLCPGVPPQLLAYEVNVVSFQSTQRAVSGVFGSNLTYLDIPPFGEDGYAALDLASGDGGHALPGGVDAQGAPVLLKGLPVTGFMAYNIINTNAQPGMLANYGGAFPHRATFSCVGGQGCSTTPSGD